MNSQSSPTDRELCERLLDQLIEQAKAVADIQADLADYPGDDMGRTAALAEHEEAVHGLRASVLARIETISTPPPTREEIRGWQDIATAPKDGAEVLAYASGGHFDVASWHRDHLCGVLEGRVPFTHWMPLPEPPALSADLPGQIDE